MKTSARTTTTVLVGLALTIACAGIAPAALANPASETARSSSPQTVPVAGRQIPVDAGNGLYKMRGSLIGDWRYIPTKVLHDEATLYAEAGVEVFNGCIDSHPRDGKCTKRDVRGELHLAFLYWASFDASGDLIQGQCVHPITGGRGGFAGARGLLNMVDRPVGDQVKTTYVGNIQLNAVPSEGNADTPSSASTAAATVAAQSTSTTSKRMGC